MWPTPVSLPARATMVLVSTDKAVNPASVMGATKRIAESYCQALADSQAAGGLRLVTVRFGNVIGSSGSVVPLFQRQIADGGPVTVTDPDVARYFMTTREAVQLLLQASALGAGEEGGGIYVLDMGKPIKIVDLARQMVRLAGLTPDKDIEIVFTGLRPGREEGREPVPPGRADDRDRDAGHSQGPVAPRRHHPHAAPARPVGSRRTGPAHAGRVGAGGGDGP